MNQPLLYWREGLRAEGNVYARPRVIRGTRAKPLPLLPSGPGGVCSRPLHGARHLAIDYGNRRPLRHYGLGPASRTASATAMARRAAATSCARITPAPLSTAMATAATVP